MGRGVADTGFSALQRAEIAEIQKVAERSAVFRRVSVLFNEPKLLKFAGLLPQRENHIGFSALQRAEIAEIAAQSSRYCGASRFQCSSTSRNC